MKRSPLYCNKPQKLKPKEAMPGKKERRLWKSSAGSNTQREKLGKDPQESKSNWDQMFLGSESAERKGGETATDGRQKFLLFERRT